MPEFNPFLDSPEFARRVGVLRTLGLGFALVLSVVTVGFGMVVWFALDGVPLAGNLYKLAGVPVPTLAATVVVLATPFVAVAAGQARGRAGVRAVAAAHPELAGSADEADHLVDAFAGVVYAESAVAFGAGFACAVLFHITTDPVILAGVGMLVAFLVIRRPTLNRARDWLLRAAQTVEDLRRNRS